MMNKFPESNIIMVYRTVKREDELARFFRTAIISGKGNSKFKEYNATTTGSADISNMLDVSKRNLVFVISSDEAFISPLLSTLESLNIYNIQINGLPTWQDFESIDFMAFQNLQVNIFDNNFIDLTHPQRQFFRKAYISRFHTDPVPSAYNGFDLVYNLSKHCTNNRTDLNDLIKKSFNNDDVNFKFREIDSGGMENTNITVIKFSDYKLESVPLR